VRGDVTEHRETLARGLIDRAARLSAATLHEASGRRGALPATIRSIDRSMRMTGIALPVRCPAGDNLWIHEALAVCRPGDVLVVDTGGGVEFGYWGEIMATAAIARGAAGLVITGGVRDSLRLIDLGLPTFSSTITIRGTGKDRNGDGAVGEPVRIGEIVVRAGDLVFGDADGVIILTPEQARQAIPASEKRDADEVEIIERIKAGALTLDVYTF
jgi:4-hydroxy-4-methyl-2-oxoglutarate aldolase